RPPSSGRPRDGRRRLQSVVATQALRARQESMKSLVVGKRKDARREQVQDNLVQGSKKRVLVIDVGGNSVKILATGEPAARSFKSGPTLSPREMVSRVKKLARDWTYEVVSIGYPGPVWAGREGGGA